MIPQQHRFGLGILLIYLVLVALPVSSQGRHTEQATKHYQPARVIYDFSSSEISVLNNILNRVSMLQNVYEHDAFDASIVVVIHEGAIPLFRKTDHSRRYSGTAKSEYAEVLQRAESLALGSIIEFRVCRASAKMQGLSNVDLADFVTMVPMADAEIIALQQQGYAYLR